MKLNLNCIGREKIFTDEKEINKSNVLKVLKKAYAIHRRNAGDAQYLIDYEAGVQPLPYKKIVRSDIDIRTTDNRRTTSQSSGKDTSGERHRFIRKEGIRNTTTRILT